MFALKKFGLALAMFGAACAGDLFDVLDNVYYPVVYGLIHPVQVAQDCYQRPFELKKEYKINGGRLEVYFGNRDIMYKVKRDLSVNQKPLRVLLEERGRKVLDNSRKIISDIIDDILEGY